MSSPLERELAMYEDYREHLTYCMSVLGIESHPALRDVSEIISLLNSAIELAEPVEDLHQELWVGDHAGMRAWFDNYDKAPAPSLPVAADPKNEDA